MKRRPEREGMFPIEGVNMKKILTSAILCAVLLLTMVPTAFAASNNYNSCMAAINQQKTVQTQAHQRANNLRAQGYKDSSAYVQAEKAKWNAAQAEINAYWKLSKYSDEDLRILTTVVYYEAGNTTEQLRQYVAQVVLNRVGDSRFPDTIKDVIEQKGQYSTKYTTVQAANAIGSTAYATCESSAKKAMMGKVNMPSNVLFQANFKQGKGVWQSVYFNSGHFASTSYFCYG